MIRTTSKAEEDKELAPKQTLQQAKGGWPHFRATICTTTLIAEAFMIQLESRFAWNAFTTHMSHFFN